MRIPVSHICGGDPTDCHLGGVDLHDSLIVALPVARKARVVRFDAKAAKKLDMEWLR